MPEILKRIEEYIVETRKKDTYWFVFNTAYNDIFAFDKEPDIEPSDGLFAMYKVCLNEKFVDNEARNEFLQFMQKEFPNTKLIEVLDLIGPSYKNNPYLGSIAVDCEKDDKVFLALCQKYGNPYEGVISNNKAFWVDNNIVATGEITAFGASDIRLKSNIKPINSALGFLGKVKTYEFDWNEKAISLNPIKTKKGAGVIAQEMSLLDNNFVHSIYGEYLGVDYERFIPYLIGGVNEVADEVTILKKRVAELELEVKNIKNANNIL